MQDEISRPTLLKALWASLPGVCTVEAGEAPHWILKDRYPAGGLLILAPCSSLLTGT